MAYTNLGGQVRVGVRPAVTAEQLQTATYLLDSYSGASAAYSLRKLSNSWSGSAIRVRRSVDNVEQNIGFDAGGNLDTTSLLNFTNFSDISTSKLLDQYSGAAAAYSLRKLSSAWSGSAIRVRRSVDNVEQNIGFDAAGNLDTASLLSFTNEADRQTSKLLDSYGDSSAAYSLRKLSDTYSGFAIRVRRSSDNIEQNIGFDVSGNLDTVSLLSFVGSGNGYVTTWYDQSGNGRNSIQTTSSQQPEIVLSGSVITTAGKPTVRFGLVSGGVTYLQGEFSSNTSNFTFLFVGNKLSANGGYQGVNSSLYNWSAPVCFRTNVLNDWSNTSNIGSRMNNGGAVGVQYNSVLTTQSFSFNTNYLVWNQKIGNQLSTAKNSDSLTTSTVTTSGNITSSLIILGGNVINNDSYLNGYLSEIIVYSKDQSSNRGWIESNINSYYSIYTAPNNAFVTTWYDQSGNGKNAIQTTSSSQPKVVNNGSLILLNNKPSIQWDGSNDTLVAYSTPNTTLNGLTTMGIITVTKPNSQALQYGRYAHVRFEEGGGWGQIYQSATTTSIGYRFGTGESGNSPSYNTSINNIIFSTYKNGTSEIARLNGVDVITTTRINSSIANTNNTLHLGLGEFTTYYGGLQNEVIIYTTNKVSDRVGIELNINSYYSIYTSNLFVTTWYDQSGNGKNVTQTTSANQPQIVSNGSILLRNGKPAIDFTSGQTLRAESRVIGVSSTSVFNVFSIKSLTARVVPWDIGLNTPYTYYAFDVNTWQTSGQKFGFYTSGRALDTNIPTNLSQNMLSIISNNSQGSTINTNTTYHMNNKLATLPVSTAQYPNFTSASRITFGSFNGENTVGFSGTHQEFIAYQTNKLTDRTSITNDMNGYYSIWDGSIVQSGLVLNLDASFKSSYLGTGSTWTDISYNGNNGTLTNGVGYSSANGGVMTFDGVNDYVQMSNALTLGTNQFTIEFWINNKYNYTSGNFKNTILSNYLDYNSSWNTYLYIGIYYGTSGGDFGSFNSNGDIYLINSVGNFIMNPSNTGKINITNNQWTHVCFVRNGNDVSTYKNGVKLATINNVSTANNNYSGSRSFRIGGGVSSAQNHFGDLSNNRIYNTALTDAEVLQNFNASKSRFGL